MTDVPEASAAGTMETLSRWDRLSTGLKMWIILSIGLLPLGIVAVTASVDNARANRDQARIEVRALLAEHVQRFTLALSRNAVAIRIARVAIVESSNPPGVCRRWLERLARIPFTPGRFALYGQAGELRCASQGFSAPAAPPAVGGGRAMIAPGGDRLLIFLYGQDGEIEGVSEYRRDVLAQVVDTPPLPGDFALELVARDRIMPLRGRPGAATSEVVSAENPFANNDYALRVRMAAPPISLSGILVVLTPILMWLWASLVGWIIVQRLLLGPLARIQKLISAYKPGDRLDLPTVRSPAQEIGALGLAFAGVTRTVARHEADLEAAVERQTRLVREVHHRVKNNLQVVASLLNIHARGAAGAEVAAAYASIQRRVDALAVVHRNHFAELEENRGVALKPLISELAANLRATAPPGGAAMQMRLDVAPLSVNQDVAVSVAFLVTEIAEFGMLCGAGLVSITLDPEEGGTARLSIEVDALAGAIDCDAALEERFDRIIIGLARQLRSTLDRDSGRGLYSVRIAIVEAAPQAPA